MADKLVEVGRLAFRHEGENWNAYYALRQDSMDGAVPLGSLAMRFAADPKHKMAFMGLMRSVVANLLKEIVGKDVEWREPRPAPESERSGNA